MIILSGRDTVGATLILVVLLYTISAVDWPGVAKDSEAIYVNA